MTVAFFELKTFRLFARSRSLWRVFSSKKAKVVAETSLI